MQKRETLTTKLRENPWVLSTFVLGVLVLILLVGSFQGFSGNTLSEKEAGENLVKYLSEIGYTGFIVNSVDESKGFYLVNTEYNGEEVPFYVTKSGYIVGNSLISIAEDVETSTTTTTSNVPKSDKPVVELFVMSYCPYGTQAEKGIIPVAELLGDKIDFKIRYVYYVMHGEKEVTENLREYCIQKEQPDKFLDYMRCFLEGNGVVSGGYITEGKNVNTCLSQAGIDTTKLNSCMDATDKEFEITKNLEDESLWMSGTYPLFNVDKELNNKYSVGGSPTLVINGVQSNAGRSSASYLDAICQAFTEGNIPSECGTQLSSASPSVYFGWDTTSSSTTTGNVCS